MTAQPADTADTTDIALIEELAANALPPAFIQLVDGWRLRYTFGVTRRANSVLAAHDGGLHSLETRLEAAKAFYTRYGLPPRFQLSPVSQPAGLDGWLAERGYRREGLVEVQSAPLVSLLTHTATQQATIETQLSADWYGLFSRIERAEPRKVEVRRALLTRIPCETAFVTVSVDKGVAAVGLGVLERGHIGLFNLATDPTQRRRGAALSAVHALSAWAAARGAHTMYLQVAAENTVAKAFYAHLGFATSYCYHYREAPR